MITVSIHPFNPKKISALIATLIGLSTVSCFADSLYMSVPSTPYDRQMTRIQPVLLSSAAAHKENVSLGLVNHWIQDLRGLPYGYSAEWKTPSEVQSAPFADCKGKAVALDQKMTAHGAKNVRLVIGRRTSTSRKTHAWLEWNTGSASYVLDPTINWSACRTAKFDNGTYVPLFAYAGTNKYRAAVSSTLFAKN